MRFRNSSTKPPPWLNKRDQWRLLRLVGLLMMVVLAMRMAANPNMWRWMFPNGGVAENAAPPEPRPRDLDFRVRPEEDRALREDEFVARPGARGPEVQGQEPRDATQPETAHNGQGTDEELDAELDRGLFAAVRDNTLGIRSFEAEAFYQTLAHTRDVGAAALREAGRTDVAFTVLMVESERFRGVPVTVEGDLRRLQWTPVVIPDEEPDGLQRTRGIAGFYEAWLFTRDSGNNPYRLVLLEVPRDMRAGDFDPPPRVRFTGYFFKRQGYATQSGGLHTAPLLIGHRLQALRPRPSAPAPDLPLGRYIAILAALIAVSLGTAVWRFTVSDRRFQRQHLNRVTEAPREAIAALDGLEAVDPADVLRRLEEADAAKASDHATEANGRA